MPGREPLEQEYYEQFIEQGLDEYDAAEIAHDWSVDAGEYDEPEE